MYTLVIIWIAIIIHWIYCLYVQVFGKAQVLQTINVISSKLEWCNCKVECNYNDAVLYSIFCNHSGHTDWRLPTNRELFVITSVPNRIELDRWLWTEENGAISLFYNTATIHSYDTDFYFNMLKDSFERVFTQKSYILHVRRDIVCVLESQHNLCLVRDK
jgi:hypothetical protein